MLKRLLTVFTTLIQLCTALPLITSPAIVSSNGVRLAEASFTPAAIPIPNVGYLGVGYNILKGNPRPTDLPFDPGFGSAIYDLSSYRNSKLSADLRFILPDNTEFADCNACQWHTATNIITGEESYRQSIFSQISLHSKARFYNLFKASFEASDSSKVVTQETLSMNRILVETSATCLAYCGNIMAYAKPAIFTQNFLNAIASLVVPTSTDNKTAITSALRFFDAFGTHTITSVKLGSVLWERMTFDLLKWKRYASFHSTASISASANALFGMMRGSLSGSRSTDESSISEFGSLAETRSRYSLGPTPPANGSWYDSVAENPMPVKFSLLPITELLTPLNFPSDSDINAKRLFLEDMLQNQYCDILKEQGAIADCSLDANDFGLPNVSTFGGMYCANCDSSRLGQNSYVNIFTGEHNCPMGFEPFPLATADTPAKAALVLCLKNSSQHDGTFGGMYTNFDCGGKKACNSVYQQFNPNPVTASYSCGSDYQSLRLTEGRINNCCDSRRLSYEVFACFRKTPTGSLAGFYSQWSDSTPRSLNPMTFALSCPKPYKATKIANGWTGSNDVPGYVCN